MPNERDRKKEFDLCYESAWSGFGSWQALAKEDLRAYLGDSLSAKEKGKMKAQERDILFLQLIRRYVNWLHGYQCEHRNGIRYDPIEGQDKLTTSQLNGCLNIAMNRTMGYEVISEGFKHALKTGLCLINAFNDANQDTSLECLYYNQFLIDPNFTKVDLKDCQYGILRKYITKDDAKMLLPEDTYTEIDRIDTEQIVGVNRFPNYPTPSIYGNKLLAYDEFQQRTSKETKIVFIKPLMKEIEWKGTKKQLDEMIELIIARFGLSSEQISTFTRRDSTVDVTSFINGVEMKYSQDPFGIGDFSFTPVIGVFDPEYDQMDVKLQGIVRRLVPLQKVSTKRIMAMLAWFDQQIGAGTDAEQGALIDPEDLYKTGPGQSRLLAEGAISQNKIRERTIADLPSGFLATHQIINELAPQIVNLNEDMFGSPQKDTELYGVVQQMRIGMGLIGNRGLFDNLSGSQKSIGTKLLKLIQQWPAMKVQRTLNQQPSPAFYEGSFGKYDCNVSEGLMTNTQRQTFYSEMIQLKKMGAEFQDPAPITWKSIIKYAPIQVGEELEKEIAQLEQQQAQAKQRQEQINQILQKMAMSQQQSDIQNTQMDTAQKQSQVIENTADTALQRARTMGELKALEVENQMKLLNAAIELEKLRVRKIEVGAKVMEVRRKND
ncbi:MAG: hypothetical protein IMZ53_11405 [Thermoplasmata archaeon]|nr:hypothetical protein [Thermoplasmata archaeon]